MHPANKHPIRLLTHLFSLVLIAILTACSPSPPEPTSSDTGEPATSQVPASVGTQPAPRTIEYDWMSVATWQKMHAEDAAIAAQGGIDLLFIGDSITAGWDWGLWEKHFAPLGAANFGIGGDHTANLLWRLQNGATGKLQPKVVVLLIGVNNFGHLNETPEQVFAGVSAVVGELQRAFPDAKILLNGVLPYGQAAATPERAQVTHLNQLLATLEQQPQVSFADYGHLFLEADGSISPTIMGDYLHLTETGYARWAEAMLPSLQAWLNP